MDKILEVLGQLDIDNDEHWTADGLPVVAVVEELAGVSVSRADIKAAAPKFTRSNNVVTEPATDFTAPKSLEPTIVVQGEMNTDFAQPWATIQKTVADEHNQFEESAAEAKTKLDELKPALAKALEDRGKQDDEIAALTAAIREQEALATPRVLSINEQTQLLFASERKRVEAKIEREKMLASVLTPQELKALRRK